MLLISTIVLLVTNAPSALAQAKTAECLDFAAEMHEMTRGYSNNQIRVDGTDLQSRDFDKMADHELIDLVQGASVSGVVEIEGLNVVAQRDCRELDLRHEDGTIETVKISRTGRGQLRFISRASGKEMEYEVRKVDDGSLELSISRSYKPGVRTQNVMKLSRHRGAGDLARHYPVSEHLAALMARAALVKRPPGAQGSINAQTQAPARPASSSGGSGASGGSASGAI